MLHMRSIMMKGAAVILAALVGALATYVLLNHRSDSIQSIPGIPGEVEQPILRLFDPKTPLMQSGSRTTLQAAAVGSSNELYLPASLPSEDVPEVWFDPATNEVAVRYGSTLVLTFDEWERGQDPGTEYAQEARDWSVGAATTISGNPAWIIPKDAQAAGQPPVTVVHVSMGPWDITIFGDMSTDELTQIAASLAPSASPAGTIPGGSA